MTESLIRPFYEVMHKYQKYFSNQGVIVNLETWFEKKKSLISMLRNHPNWNETAMAIIMDVVENREIDQDVVNTHCSALIQLAEFLSISDSRKQTFAKALKIATSEYSSSLSESYIEPIKEISGISCVSGQKTSRFIGKLCKQFKITEHPDYNKVFANLSDALNPITIIKKGLLSVHPCDYLEMSSKSNSWSSCHNLDNGSYQAGCLSYMTDRDTMIFYTVDNNVVSDYFKASKRSRQVFCYHNGILLQSRLYPKFDKSIIKQNRDIVQEAIAKCLGADNKWLKIKPENRANYYTTVSGSKHYTDYTNKDYGIVTTLKNFLPIEYEQLQIGSRPFCVCCGKNLTDFNKIKCNCKDMVVCKDCGNIIPVTIARYIEDRWFCNTCLNFCGNCGKTYHGNLVRIFDGYGNSIEVCHECHEESIAVCKECTIQPICSSLICNRFCKRAAITENLAA